MVAAAATMLMFSSSSQCNTQNKILSSASSGKPTMPVSSPERVDVKSKPTAYKGLQVNGNSHGATNKINGTKVNGTAVDSMKHNVGLKEASEEESTAKNRINQLPDWSMLLETIAIIILAAEKQWTNSVGRVYKTHLKNSYECQILWLPENTSER